MEDNMIRNDMSDGRRTWRELREVGKMHISVRQDK